MRYLEKFNEHDNWAYSNRLGDSGGTSGFDPFIRDYNYFVKELPMNILDVLDGYDEVMDNIADLCIEYNISDKDILYMIENKLCNRLDILKEYYIET